VILVLLACAGPRRTEPVVGPVALSPVEAHGEHVFMEQCSQCHPEGGPGLGPSLNDRPLPGWLIRVQVRVGFGPMPAFSKTEVEPADLDAVVAYLRALRHPAPRRQGEPDAMSAL
jgi:mono/diheme cytochrome c family protein